MQNMNMKPLDVFNFKTDVFYYVRYTIVQHSITIAVHITTQRVVTVHRMHIFFTAPSPYQLKKFLYGVLTTPGLV